MLRSINRICALTASVLTCSLLFGSAQAADIEQIDPATRATSIATVSNLVKPVVILGGLKKLVIDGQYPMTSWWLPADEIEFKPGSSIIVSNDAIAQSHEIFIVAKKLTIDDPQNPPTITWQVPNIPTPPDRGQAAAGAHGGGEGGAGGTGAGGAPGTTGGNGSDAPALTLMFEQLSPGPLIIDFKGGPGGEGGAGQKGGDGGVGAPGTHARQDHRGGPFGTTIWLPSCAAGPGWGGRGGDGGAGGPGGTGGVGGSGGSVTLISTPDALPTLTQAIRLYTDGGIGGPGGSNGPGGNLGVGGPEGQLANFCNSAGRGGQNGNPGASTPGNGQTGQGGTSGRQYVGSLTANQFSGLFGF